MVRFEIGFSFLSMKDIVSLTMSFIERKEKPISNINHQSYKEKVFDHYGWVCACCGEAEPLFLTIDHVNNDGADVEKKLGVVAPCISGS